MYSHTECCTGQMRLELHSHRANARLLHEFHAAQQQRIHSWPLNCSAIRARLQYCSTFDTASSANHIVLVRLTSAGKSLSGVVSAREAARTCIAISALLFFHCPSPGRAPWHASMYDGGVFVQARERQLEVDVGIGAADQESAPPRRTGSTLSTPLSESRDS